MRKWACRRGHHYRDGEQVWRSRHMWRTVCTGCGQAMVKKDGVWILQTDMSIEESQATDFSQLEDAALAEI